MKAGEDIRLSSWDYDGPAFWGGTNQDFAVSATAAIPSSMVASGFKIANAHGTFTVLATCNDQGEQQTLPGFLGVLP
jgi:hypothetical protein